MINNIQSSFSIQDLEILSGIKAHTIRIWEKRYGLLNPQRLNRNIRVYDLEDLQKMLNVSVLHQYKFKISEISKLKNKELDDTVKRISEDNFNGDHFVNSLLMSMFSLNEDIFEEVYEEQIKTSSFINIFISTYVPLLNYMGLLWQFNRIKPVQEHFISNLIYQKISLHIAKLPKQKSTGTVTNVLFLPKGEIHEMGLYFMYYYLRSIGRKAVYLGRDIPMEDFQFVNSIYPKINWIGNNVIRRTEDEKRDFLNQINEVLKGTTNTCQMIGKMWEDPDYKTANKQITFYNGFEDIVNEQSKKKK